MPSPAAVPGAVVIENENDCPVYVAGITPGLWFTRGRENSGPSVVRVRADREGNLMVERIGTEVAETIADNVKLGIRFVGRVEIPEWV